jgi:hypothetical protein
MVLGLHFNGPDNSTDIIDEIGHIVTCYSNGPYYGATLSTSTSVFGDSSIYFSYADGASLLSNGVSTRSRIEIPYSPEFDIGSDRTKEFTISFWIHPLTLLNYQYPIAFGPHRGSDLDAIGWLFWIEANGTVRFQIKNGTSLPNYPVIVTGTNALSISTWTHVAVTGELVSGNRRTRLFIDGVNVTSSGFQTQTADAEVASQPLTLGLGLYDPSFPTYTQYSFCGYIDDLYMLVGPSGVSNSGSCQWKANFTPPTSPFI